MGDGEVKVKEEKGRGDCREEYFGGLFEDITTIPWQVAWLLGG